MAATFTKLIDHDPPVGALLLFRRGAYMLFAKRMRDDGTICFSPICVRGKLKNFLRGTIEGQKRNFPEAEWFVIED